MALKGADGRALVTLLFSTAQQLHKDEGSSFSLNNNIEVSADDESEFTRFFFPAAGGVENEPPRNPNPPVTVQRVVKAPLSTAAPKPQSAQPFSRSLQSRSLVSSAATSAAADVCYFCVSDPAPTPPPDFAPAPARGAVFGSPTPCASCARGDPAPCRVALPLHLARHLRWYQAAAVARAFASLHAHGAFILADEMGLGKTITALAVAYALSGYRRAPCAASPSGDSVGLLRAVRTCVVTAPTSVLSEWRAQCTRWLGDGRVRVVTVDGGGLVGLCGGAAARPVKRVRASARAPAKAPPARKGGGAVGSADSDEGDADGDAVGARGAAGAATLAADLRLMAVRRGFQILLVSHAALRRCAEAIAIEVRPDLVIVDEAHVVRNARTQLAAGIRQLLWRDVDASAAHSRLDSVDNSDASTCDSSDDPASDTASDTSAVRVQPALGPDPPPVSAGYGPSPPPMCMLLTGTPLQNSHKDLQGVLALAAPGAFAPAAVAAAVAAGDGALGALLGLIMLRRTPADVATQPQIGLTRLPALADARIATDTQIHTAHTNSVAVAPPAGASALTLDSLRDVLACGGGTRPSHMPPRVEVVVEVAPTPSVAAVLVGIAAVAAAHRGRADGEGDDAGTAAARARAVEAACTALAAMTRRLAVPPAVTVGPGTRLALGARDDAVVAAARSGPLGCLAAFRTALACPLAGPDGNPPTPQPCASPDDRGAADVAAAAAAQAVAHGHKVSFLAWLVAASRCAPCATAGRPMGPSTCERRGRIVVIASTLAQLDAVAAWATTAALPTHRIDGRAKAADRTAAIARFRTTRGTCVRPHLFLLATQAGGVGIQLAAADEVVLMDNQWNPATDAQAVGRVWRDDGVGTRTGPREERCCEHMPAVPAPPEPDGSMYGPAMCQGGPTGGVAPSAAGGAAGGAWDPPHGAPIGVVGIERGHQGVPTTAGSGWDFGGAGIAMSAVAAAAMAAATAAVGGLNPAINLRLAPVGAARGSAGTASGAGSRPRRAVFVWRLVTSGSVEVEVMKRQAAKTAVAVRCGLGRAGDADDAQPDRRGPSVGNTVPPIPVVTDKTTRQKCGRSSSLLDSDDDDGDNGRADHVPRGEAPVAAQCVDMDDDVIGAVALSGSAADADALFDASGAVTAAAAWGGRARGVSFANEDHGRGIVGACGRELGWGSAVMLACESCAPAFVTRCTALAVV